MLTSHWIQPRMNFRNSCCEPSSANGSHVSHALTDSQSAALLSLQSVPAEDHRLRQNLGGSEK